MPRTSLQERKQVYHSESCRGNVVVNFYVNGKTVEGYFVDGDISSSKVVWGVVRTRNGTYRVRERDNTDTMVGKAKPELKSRTTKARTEREALASMIRSIVRPYVKPREFSFPVDAKKLREGLEAELLK